MNIGRKTIGRSWLAVGIVLTLTGSGAALGQAGLAPPLPQSPGVHAKPEQHRSGFLEDPFVTKYRRKFFAVFAGNTGEFEQGMKELEILLAKNPNDARALVWHGNGLMVRAGMRRFAGNPGEGKRLLVDSKRELDRAVSLDANNVNILAMRAVTLYMAGKYWQNADLPPGSWEAVIQDLEKSKRMIRPDRMAKLSVHARGEIYTEIATAYTRLGRTEKARESWEQVVRQVPGSDYAQRATTALQVLSNAPTATDKGASGL